MANVLNRGRRNVARWLMVAAALPLAAMVPLAHAQLTDSARAASFAGWQSERTLVPGQHEVVVSQPNGKVNVWVEDLRVKVLGGYVVVNRRWDGNRWLIAPAWSSLEFLWDSALYTGGLSVASTGGTGGGGGAAMAVTINRPADPPAPPEIYGGTVIPGNRAVPTADGLLLAIGRSSAWFQVDSTGTAFPAYLAPRYVLRPIWQGGAPPQPVVPRVAISSGGGGGGGGGAFVRTERDFPDGLIGWRWEDKTGDWIEFARDGAISRYGDRNNITVSFDYAGGSRPARVLDHHGQPVLQFIYAGDRLIEIRDVPRAGETLPARSVRYTYDGRGSIATVTDVAGHLTRYEYAPDGKLTGLVDQEGRATRFAFGPTGRVSKLIAADGAETDYRYDYDRLKKLFYVRIDHPLTAAGRQVEERWIDTEGRTTRIDVAGTTVMEYAHGARQRRMLDANGNATLEQLNEFDLVTSVTYPDGSSAAITYEPRYLNPVARRDENGTTTAYEYDAKGNLIKRTDAAGTADERITEFTVNAAGDVTSARRLAKTLANGATAAEVTIAYTYDAHGNVETFTDGEGKLIRYESNRLGDVTATVDPKGGRWTTEFDARGLITRQTDALGHATTYAYDRVGNLVKVTDARNKDVAFTYDALNRQTGLTQATGGVWSNSYDKRGRVTNQTDSTGRSMRVDYDVRGRPVQVVDGKNQVIGFDYADVADGKDKGFGRPGTITYPTFRRQLRYDVRHRVTQEADLVGEEGRVNGFGYDRVGRPASQTDANGKTWQMSYDALGRVTASSDPLGNTTRLVYDNRGNVIEFRDANGNATSFAYDRRNLLVQETDPLGKLTRYRYDDNGWLAETVLANGKRIAYEYDAAGRLTTRRAYSETNQLTQTVSFGYDAADNLTSWNDGTASAALIYDDDDRLTSETVNYGAFSLTHAYTYAGNNQIATYTGPDGVVITYGYDATGQLQTVHIPGEGIISVQAWDWVLPKQIVYPGGTQQVRTHSGYLELTGLTVRNPTQQTIFELASKYGKLTEPTERTVDSATTAFAYDEAVRLTSLTKSGTTQTYVLDAASNRTGGTAVGGGTWVYDRANQLTTRPTPGGTVTYTYDDAGNLIRKVDTSVAEPARTTHYAYDAFNRLLEVRDGANALVAAYTYDPFDRRLSKTVGATTTFYLHGEQGLLAEANSSGQITTSYGWHPEHPYGTAPLYARTVLSGGTQPAYVYYHNDHLGTPWRVTDRGGAVVWSADYDAFGKAAVAAGATFDHNLRLPGQYEDAETGLHYNDRRYYDPATGRYLTRDPIGLAGGANLYLYARANPLLLADPTGECPPCAAFALRAGLQWAFRQFMKCFAPCALVNGVTEMALNCGNFDVPSIMKECGIACVLSMIPRPIDPCSGKERFGWLPGVLGVAGGVIGGINSFPGDTPVHVKPADLRPGEHRTVLKAIRDLKPGDEVLAYAEWKPEGQRLGFQPVSETIASEREQTLVHLTLDTGETLTATAGHPLRTTEGWRDAILVKRGGQLLLKGEGDASALRAATVTAVQQEIRRVAAYNLEVANAHTFFVGEEGVLAHNVHGNSRADPRPQGIYRIFNCVTDKTRKYGVAGGPTREARSRRPREQLGPDEDFEWVDEIPSPSPGNRGRAYDRERDFVDEFARNNGGRPPPHNKRPKPRPR